LFLFSYIILTTVFLLFRYRDEIEIKGKGLMKTYYVELTDDLHLVEEPWTEVPKHLDKDF
jgi:hypothetical protein